MARLLFVLVSVLAAAHPAHAWQFSTRDSLCLLTHSEAQARMQVSYDTADPLYAIRVERYMATWPEAPIFSIRFDGPQGLTISTDRHSLGLGGAAVTVTDTGFGNVLNGLEFNTTATARLGGTEVPFDLTGAAPEVQKFRACAEGLSA